MTTLLVDMDEVLADFVGGACRVHGWTRDGLEAVWPPGRWSIVEPMGLAEVEFWRPINAAGETFWTDLDQTPDASRVVDLLLRCCGCDWFVVSSPSFSPSSYSGKVRWLKQFLGDGWCRLVLTNHKHLLARPDTVLIDDSEENIARFRQAGGGGIIYPSRHNFLHYLAADPVGYVAQQLEERYGVQVS